MPVSLVLTIRSASVEFPRENTNTTIRKNQNLDGSFLTDESRATFLADDLSLTKAIMEITPKIAGIVAIINTLLYLRGKKNSSREAVSGPIIAPLLSIAL